MRSQTTDAPGLLCIVNFPSNTGFAWTLFEEVMAAMATRFVERGVHTFVAYPQIPQPPRTLEGSPASPVVLDLVLDLASLRRVGAFIRENGIRVLYMMDRPAWHPAYTYLRRFGLRRVVVYDQTSGDRREPTGVRRLTKRLALAVPGILADDVLAVSDFVVERKVRVDLVPRSRLTRVWNSIDVDAMPAKSGSTLRAELGLDDGRILIVAGCRAHPVKGIQHLFRAFDRLVQDLPSDSEPPLLVFGGDGPYLPELIRLRDSLPSRAHIELLGYRPDLRALMAGADICAVPSTWQEAFGIAVLEPMALGLPVVASAVGGIPEIVVDEETGLLVPAADVEALAAALGRLVQDPDLRVRLGKAGLARALRDFTWDQQIQAVADIVARGLTPTT